MAKLIADFFALLYLVTFVANVLVALTIKYNTEDDIVTKKVKLDALASLTGTIIFISGIIMAISVLAIK